MKTAPLIAALLLSAALAAQTSEPVISFQLNAHQFRLTRWAYIPNATLYHVKSTYPVWVGLITPGIGDNYSMDPRYPCQMNNVLDAIIPCPSTPTGIGVRDLRNVKNGELSANTVTIERIFPTPN
jgi:hypothetical protein